MLRILTLLNTAFRRDAPLTVRATAAVGLIGILRKRHNKPEAPQRIRLRPGETLAIEVHQGTTSSRRSRRKSRSR